MFFILSVFGYDLHNLTRKPKGKKTMKTMKIADLLADEMTKLADFLGDNVGADVMARFYETWETLESAIDE
jgi:hypothetical protein